MASKNQKLIHVAKRLSQLLLLIIVLFSIVLGIGWKVLRTDHAYVIQRIQETALEEWNAKIQLEGYELQWVRPFPLIRFQIRDLHFSTAKKPDYPVLKITHAVSEFNPWNLITGDFNAHPLLFDSVWIHLYNDSLDNSNLVFDENDSKKSTEKKASHFDIELDELPTITINYLDFHHQNDFKKKWHWAKLTKAHIQPERGKNRQWSAHLQSDCYFEGLVFSEKDGGFLMDTDGKLDLNVSLTNRGKTLQLANSFLQVGPNKYLLDAEFRRGAYEELDLEIASDGVVMTEVLPLLSGKINRVLDDIHIDQPIRASFSLNNPLIPGRKGAMKVTFATDSACIDFREISMSGATLQGFYSNDCDEDGIGFDSTSCVQINQLDGDLFGILPTELHGEIENMKEPLVNAFGELDFDLPRLNMMLAAKDKVTFLGGHARMNFQYSALLDDILKAPFDEEKIRMKGAAAFADVNLNMKSLAEPIPSLSGSMTFDDNETLLEDLSLNWLGSNIQLTGRLNNLPEFLWYPDQSLNSDLVLHFDQLDLNKFKGKGTSEKKESKPKGYKHLQEMVRRVASNINGKIDIQMDQLIVDTFFLTDLKTQFHLYSPLRSEFADSSLFRVDQLTAKFMGTDPIFVNFSLPQNEMDQVIFDLKAPFAERFANALLRKKMKITKGNASLALSARVPLQALMEAKPFLPDLRFDGVIDLDQIELEVNGFSWPVKKLSGALVLDNDRIQLDALQFQYEGSTFSLNGQITDYAFLGEHKGRKASVDLYAKGSHLDFRNNQQRSVNSRSTSNKKNTLSPPQLFRALDTVFYYTTGKIDLRLDSILTLDHTIEPFVLQARLMPDETNSKHHQVKVDSFNFGFNKQNNVRGSARLTNPNDPQIDAEFQAKMKFERLGEFLPSEYIDLQDGYFTMNLRYQSPLYDTINAKNYLLNAHIDGKAELVDGKIFYNYRDFSFEHINGQFLFDQRALYIKDLNLEINGSQLYANGQSSDFFPFFILPDRRANIVLNVGSPRFDFGGFTAPHGLGKDTLISIPNKKIKTNVDTTQTVLSKTGGFIDELLAKGSLEMSTAFKELVYNEFLASNVTGKISLQPDTVRLRNLRMDIADGSFTVDGSITNIVYHQPKMELNVQLNQNDLREIFRQFENFGQAHLGYTNLEGNASANIRFKADVNSNYAVLPATMHGDIQVKLSGGQLIEVDALKKVTGFLFRKRRLDHILIDTLETFTHIRGSDLYVDKFYLHSSSFDFGAEGVYSLGTNNKTRILFAVPLSNLFRRHLTRKEMESGNSKRKGMRIFIEARQKKNRLRFFLKIPIFGKKKYRLIEEGGG